MADEAARTSGELRERFSDTPEATLVQQSVAAARPAPATATPEASRPAPRFAVQLGAFEDRTNALRLQGTLPRDLGPAQILEDAPAGRARIYRVVVGGFATHEAASSFATEKVAPRGLAWQVVPLPEDARR